MPVSVIDIAQYEVQSDHQTSASLRLCTDEPDLGALPPPLRWLADEIWLTRAPAAAPWRSAGTGQMLWNRGERLLQGSAEQIGQAAGAPGRRTFVPVHYDAGAAWELVGLEPRWYGPGTDGQHAEHDEIDPGVRIAAAATAAAGNAATPNTEPWSRLRSILAAECAHLGAGVAPLAALAQEPGLHALLHALCLRNLVAMLMRQNEDAQAAALLAQARVAHPQYRELDYLEARVRIAQGQMTAAFQALRRATAPQASVSPYVGSGGESSYRAHHLLATMAEHTGQQAVVVRHFLTGVLSTPLYAPALAGLLRQRLPTSLLPGMEVPLLRLGRQEPQVQSAIFDFFLRHRSFACADRALQIWRLPAGVEAQWQIRLAAFAPLRQPLPRTRGERAGVIVHGPFLLYASVARINRYLAEALCGDVRLDTALEPSVPGTEPAAAFPAAVQWTEAFRHTPTRLDLTIRHGWPPEFAPPATGKLALILPWEFGAIPRAWVRPLRNVDEIWTPSEFTRGVLVRGGALAERVHVIPNGVNRRVYCSEGEQFRPQGARGTCFLFVGGAIQRKGMDVLLAAWRAAFGASDDVSLVIKDIGAHSYYRHITLAQEIASLARDPQAAPVVYLDAHLSEERMAALYRGCDVLVLPYRGEGFGLPLAEALACGKPVITTAAGPAREFCPEPAAWWVEAREREVPASVRPPEAMTGPFTWYEPALPSLVQALRAAAAAEPAERARRGGLGASHIHAHYGWNSVTARYLERVAELTGTSTSVSSRNSA
ncbi:MAG: glycosyltransferase family 4 protein [Terriglobales bacterium]